MKLERMYQQEICYCHYYYIRQGELRYDEERREERGGGGGEREVFFLFSLSR